MKTFFAVVLMAVAVAARPENGLNDDPSLVPAAEPHGHVDFPISLDFGTTKSDDGEGLADGAFLQKSFDFTGFSSLLSAEGVTTAIGLGFLAALAVLFWPTLTEGFDRVVEAVGGVTDKFAIDNLDLFSLGKRVREGRATNQDFERLTTMFYDAVNKYSN